MKNAVFAVFFVVLCGCSNTSSEIEEKVRSSLKDPDSAKFSERKIHHAGKNGAITCGTVNAKNSFGGYSGAMAYMHFQGDIVVASNEAQSLTVTMCCMHVIEAATSGKSAWEQDGFTTACSGMPGSRFDFTKPL